MSTEALAPLLDLLRQYRVKHYRHGSLYVELQYGPAIPEPQPAMSTPKPESEEDRAKRLKREEDELLYASAGGT